MLGISQHKLLDRVDDTIFLSPFLGNDGKNFISRNLTVYHEKEKKLEFRSRHKHIAWWNTFIWINAISFCFQSDAVQK